MRQHVLNRLTNLLGPANRPESEPSSKLHGWQRIAPNLDVVLQVDAPEDGRYGQVWIPWPKSQDVPSHAEHYPPVRNRHHHLSPYSTVWKGRNAVKFRIRTMKHLEELLAIIENRMKPCTA